MLDRPLTSAPRTTSARRELRHQDPGGAARREWVPAEWLGLAYVGVIGGGLAFVLFFDGLAQSEPASAAFWRDTLVIWVALLAVVLLRERMQWWNIAAIGMLIAGEVVVSGGVGHLAANRGELYVLASSVLWAGEVVVARRLLRDWRLRHCRCSHGCRRGGATRVPHGDGRVRRPRVVYLAPAGWALATGLLLGGYVATWMTALSRARALDVTSVLASSALITWLLQLTAGTATFGISSLGLALIALGAGLVAVGAFRSMRSLSPDAPAVTR